MTEPSNNRIGQRFGSFEITKFLGRGGFANVFLGRNVNLPEQEVAIKVLDKIMIQFEKAEQFKKEAQIILSLRHPSIVQFYLYDIYWNPQKTNTAYPYIVMEYASKGSLRSIHPRGTKLALEKMMTYVKQISNALHFAHSNQVMHLDVKPENILVNKQGKLLLSDFGLATVITEQQRSKDIQGTLSYMAPEQFQGHPDKASDQYSLAVMVYEWICGTVPFIGQTIDEHINKLLYEPPPSLTARIATLDPTVEDVVMRGLSKNPQDRYASVRQFAEQLEKAMTAPGQIKPALKIPAVVMPVQAPVPINLEKQVQAPSPLAHVEKPKQPEEASSVQPAVVQREPEGPGLLPVASPSVGEKEYRLALDPQLATNFERYEEHLAYYGLSMQEPANWDDPDLDLPIPLRLTAIQADQNALQLYIDKNMAYYRTYLNKFETTPNGLDAFTTSRHCFAVRYGQRAFGTPADQILQWSTVLHQLLAQVRYPDLRRLVLEDITLTPAVPLAYKAANQPVHLAEELNDGGPIPVQSFAAVPPGSPFFPGRPPKQEANEPDDQPSQKAQGGVQPPFSTTNTPDSQHGPFYATQTVDSGQGEASSMQTNTPFFEDKPQKTPDLANQQRTGGTGTTNSKSPFLGYGSAASYQHAAPDINNIKIGPLPGSFEQNNAQTMRTLSSMDDPSPPAIPPYLGRPGNGGLYEPEENSLQDMLNQSVHDFLQPRRGRHRVTSSPLFFVFIAGSFLGATFFAVWLGHESPSSDNGTAWLGFIISLGLSIGMFLLFDYSDNGLIKISAATILAFVWSFIGYAFAAIIGGGSHIGILPGPTIMALFFLFGTLVLCLRKINRPRRW